MDRNRKWVAGFGAVLLILSSHMSSALEVPLDRKYRPHQYHSYYDYQNSKFRIVFTSYSSCLNTSALWKTNVNSVQHFHIVGRNERHYSLYGPLKGLKSSCRLSNSLLVFLCFSFACSSMGSSLRFSVTKCNSISEELYQIKLLCLQLLFLHWLYLPDWTEAIEEMIGRLNKMLKSTWMCNYFTWTCGLLLAKTNTFPQYSITVVRRVMVDKKLKYWKDVSCHKRCCDF